MSIGDMFDTAFKLYRQHFLTFVGIVALLQIPMVILRYLLEYVVGHQAALDVLQISQRASIFRPGGPAPLPPNALPWRSLAIYYAITFGIAIIQGLLIQSLLTGALANAIARTYHGQETSILAAYRLGWRRYLALVASALLQFLIAMVVLGLFAGCAFGVAIAIARTLSGARAIALAGVIGALSMIVALVLFVLVLALFFIRFILTTQAIVLEGRGPISGLGRSWRLIRGSFWRSLAIGVLVALLSYIISLFPALLVSSGLGMFSQGDAAAVLRDQAVGTLVAQVGSIFAAPLLFSIYTLLYYDLRIRKEGYDLELMAQQAAAA